MNHRLSGVEQLILELLHERLELYGLQLVDASHGRLKRGTVYVTLGRMEQKGLVESRAEPAASTGKGPVRRLYRPTAYGVRVLHAWETLSRLLAPEAAR
jgi:PadR family transcriptional regulator